MKGRMKKAEGRISAPPPHPNPTRNRNPVPSGFTRARRTRVRGILSSLRWRRWSHLGRGWTGLKPAFLGLALLLSSVLLLAQDDPPPGPFPAPPTAAQVRRLERREIRPLGPTFASVNTASREAVRNFHTAVHGASRAFSLGWTGDHTSCDPGTTDPAFRDKVELRINYFRALAGVPASIAFSPTLYPKTQAAALMMSANDTLSHSPPPGWTCFSSAGAEAAGNSNLAIGNAGPEAVDAYMDDYGNNNASVGHRRWLLYPQTQLMASGDIPFLGPTQRDANAIWILDGHFSDPRPATRDGFVAWPPPGFVPAPMVSHRWSFSYPKADFTSAAVAVTSKGAALPVEIASRSTGAGENSLVWLLNGLSGTHRSNWPVPAEDTSYQVAVNGVRIDGRSTNFNYTVTVFDPARHGADTVLPVPAGPAEPAVGQANTYTFAAVPLATAYQWRRSNLAPFTTVEGGEAGLSDFELSVSGGYEVLIPQTGASGQFAFHLVHPPSPTTQTLTYRRLLRPHAGAELRFRSRLGWSAPDQSANISVSVDGGTTWRTIYSQSGTDGAGETAFVSRSISLADFVGQAILCRFSYVFDVGAFFPQTDPGVGWSFDDLSWTNTDELNNATVDDVVGGQSFVFVPAQTGGHALEVRGLVAGSFPLEWSPIVAVNAVNAPTPTVTFVPGARLAEGQFHCDFEVTNHRPGLLFVLQRAASPGGSWTDDTGATFETLTAGLRFRATTPAGESARAYFRMVLK